MKIIKEKSKDNKISKSKFIRSFIILISSVFLILTIVIIVIVSNSFINQINDNYVNEKETQLITIEKTFEDRMTEVKSMAYHLGESKHILNGSKIDSNEIGNLLENYLVGNDFIDHIAYLQLSNPNKIYTKSGDLNFSIFLQTELKMPKEATVEIINEISQIKEITLHVQYADNIKSSYLSYAYPLPSDEPVALVLVLISLEKIQQIFQSEFSNDTNGQIFLSDHTGKLVYQMNNFEDNQSFSDISQYNNKEYFTKDNKKYLFLEVSNTEVLKNEYSYATILEIDNAILKVVKDKLLLIIVLVLLMVLSIILIIIYVINRFGPIYKIALALDEKNNRTRLIDEQSVLIESINSLRNDREMKQKYEEAYHEANAANKAKSVFLSNMSHDIRTPMNAIIGMTEIALDHVDDPIYTQECLLKIESSSKYLLDIINNVLDMSRIEANRFVLSEDVIDLSYLIHNIINILIQNLKNNNLNFNVRIDNVVHESFIGDNVRLTQIFVNILSNSIKFTLTGGEINLRIIEENNDNSDYSNYSFIFQDNGIGMSPDFVSKVFDTFSRDMNSILMNIEGTGLGMSICKNLVELMGGTITCDSELGKGTTFTIKLKMKLVNNNNDSYLPNYKQNVLIIGNNKDECLNQVEIFSSLNINTEYCVNYTEASKLIKKSLSSNEYHYILINQNTDLNGLEIVKKLKKLTTPNTLFVICTQDLLLIDQSLYFNNGISFIIQTPIFRSSIITLLENKVSHNSIQNNKIEIDLKDKHIMLVEDNQINREIANILLECTHATVVNAENGKVAINLFSKSEVGYFDLILMDLKMPIMNGYEATKTIRNMKRPDAKTIPIYALTANTFDEDVRQVKEAGMNGHLSKPYNSQDLYRLLDENLNKK